jgi:PAS domain S-box-containing protein
MKKLEPDSDNLADKLERALSLNKAILSVSLDAIITITSKSEVVDFNEAATHIFGWQKEEIIGQQMVEYIVPPELRAAHMAGMQCYLETGKGPVLNKRMELPALHKEGHQFPIEIAISPLITGDDTMFIAFIRDITDHKKAETELRLAARTFDSDEAITITDRDNKIIRVNNAFTRITGYEAEEVLGMDHSVLASGRHDTEFYQDIWRQLLERGNWSGEIYNRRKNGEIFPEHLYISAVKDANGEITHYVAHFVDISKQKENEEKLLQAQYEAEAASNAKGLFLANMSHEIRTPMNGVLGILDLLMDTSLDSKQRHLVKTGQASGAHLLNIINDILDYSKMDAGHLELASVSFDLYALLDSIMEVLQPQTQNKHLAFTLEKSSVLVQYVKGDPFRLRQILLNLISNAIKFTDQGVVKVHVSSTPGKQGNSTLHISVEDTGIGVAPEDRDSLFDVFTMADQSHTRTSEGSGLGLAICKQLVTRMGGNISFDSEVGKGSLFHVEVELENGDPNEIDNSHQVYGLRLKPKENTRVLLAEDNLANQTVIKSILEHAGLIVDIACNGQEAIEAVRTDHYDIVLMDISMPEVGGIEATRLIRGLDEGRGDLPIVAITAHALPGDRERFIEAGMNNYLTKPIDRDTMLRVIAHLTGDSATLKAAVNENHDDTDGPDAEYGDELMNESVLLQLARDTSTEVLPKLLELYTKDARARISRIEEAVTAKDYQTLEFESHTLGSSAGAHSNLRLQRIARQIEHLCQKNEHELALEYAKALSEIAETSLQLLTERAADGFELSR